MTTTSRAAAPARLARRTMTGLTAAAAATLVAFSLLAAPAGASAPGSAAAIPGALAAVSCPATNACWAVGSQESQQPNSATLARWDGSAWSAVSLPFPKGALATQLRSVSCPSVTLCWAVGFYEPSTGGALPYVLQWNGTAWSSVTLPIPPNTNAAPSSVSCASTVDCWEAGDVSNGSPPLEHWNGTAWAPEAPPILAPPYNPATSCVRANDCWIAGAQTTGRGTYTAHWNGSVWSMVKTPTSNEASHVLLGISCRRKACTAVGRNASAGGGKGPLAERWNGSAWTITLTTGPGLKSAGLNAVSCTADGKCLAVGEGANGFSELWAGGHWHRLTTPAGVLLGVSCVTASDCWGVGGVPGDINPTTALIEHWNGTAWSIVS